MGGGRCSHAFAPTLVQIHDAVRFTGVQHERMDYLSLQRQAVGNVREEYGLQSRVTPGDCNTDGVHLVSLEKKAFPGYQWRQDVPRNTCMEEANNRRHPYPGS